VLHDRLIRPRIVWISLWSLLLPLAFDSASAQTKKPATKPAAAPAAKPAAEQDADAKDAGGDDAKKTDEKPASGKSASDKSKDDGGVDLDAKLKSKKKKEERKPNFEVRRVRTSPSDSITFIKKNHWSLFHIDLLANHEDTTLEVRTSFQPVPESPHDVQYRRTVHLYKEDERRYRLPVMLSHEYRTGSVEFALYNPGGVMPLVPPGVERQPFMLLEAEQFLIVVLSPTPDSFSFLKGMPWVVPGNDEDDDDRPEKRRYFHVITALEPSKPVVADTALAWSTTTAVIWDDLDPGLLTARQQEALIDWLYWGGQLIVSGGTAAPRLEQSFLAPYLPADVGGSGSLTDLSVMADRYLSSVTIARPTPTYRPINILPDKPVYVAELQPRPGATTTIAAGEFPLLVERPVGRGRIVMAAFSLYQPDLINWGLAYDRFWREAILRLPETKLNPQFNLGQMGRTYVRLSAQDLSTVRYLSRDLGAGARRVLDSPAGSNSGDESLLIAPTGVTPNMAPTTGTGPMGAMAPRPGDVQQKTDTVAEWRDDTAVPVNARQTLMDATGIKIPPPEFVLTAALAYLFVLVPLNWLVCRFGFRRPELAWLLAPLIIVGFSFGIIEFAKVNVGFNMTSHEIDVIEAFEGHPRAHVSRFTCVYSGSRVRAKFGYDDQAALALPMAMGKQRGQIAERLALDWDMGTGTPVALGNYEINPRSIGMTRAEELRSLGGAIRLTPGVAPDTWVIDNPTPLDLWDVHLVTANDATRLGDLAPRGKLEFTRTGRSVIPAPRESPADADPDRVRFDDDALPGYSTSRKLGDLSPARLLELFGDRRLAIGTRPLGARLVAWSPRPLPGQTIDPKPDRVIGFTVIVLQLEKP